MIGIGTKVIIKTPGRRTDGMLGVVTRRENASRTFGPFFLVKTQYPFINERGAECSAVWCDLDQVGEL